MCLSYIPPGGRKFRPHVERVSQRTKLKRRNKVIQSRKQKQQLALAECFGFDEVKGALSEAIEASGDTLIEKGKNIVRFAFQNINGILL